MKTHSELKVFPSGKYKYIYVYWQGNKQTIRINTKHLYKGKRYHLSNNLFSANEKDFEKLNADILYLKKQVDWYISKSVEYDLTPNQGDCKKYLDGKLNLSKSKKKYSGLTAQYWSFVDYKKAELLNKASIKDYVSFLNALIDFETYSKKWYVLADINLKFIWEFRDFLLTARPQEVDSKKRPIYRTKGNMNNNTLNKRLSSFRSFMLWCEKQNIWTFDKSLYDQNLKSFRPTIIALDEKELREIFDFEPDLDGEKKVMDIFKLNCLMGLRFSDLATFQKGSFFTNENGQMFYLKNNEKTDTRISVPVVSKAKEILEKYDYKLNMMTNQVFNKRLKDILKKYDKLSTPVLLNEMRGVENVPVEKLKRECVSSHTARRTYITLALQKNIPLNALMGSTGHTQLSTLQKYAATQQNFDDFDKLNNF